MTLRTSSSPRAYATTVCSDCGRHFGARVVLTEGNNEAYVKCGECGHINNADEFRGKR
jgi:uncharacterized Zn finger protein